MRVSEVMYDVSGTDSGREWVEVYNAGSSSVDLSILRFFNKQGGHTIKSYGGASTVLAPGAVAVLADKPESFLADYPGFTGVLLDSAFSLTNTGESIGMRDTEGVVQDEIAYSSDMGAAGDGNSLSRSGDSWVPGIPSPGVYASAVGTSPAEAPTEPAPAPLDSSAYRPPELWVRILGESVIVAGEQATFEAQVFRVAGVPIRNARLVWSFGDGGSAEGYTPAHTYHYPGSYMVSVAASEAYDTAQAEIEAMVITNPIILIVEDDASLTLKNPSTHELDIGGWFLFAGGQQFAIPPHTLLRPGGEVRFSPLVTKLAGDEGSALLFPGGAVAVRAERDLPDAPPQPVSIATSAVSAPVKTIETPKPSAATVPRTEVENTQLAAASAASFTLPWWGALAGLAAILSLGVMAAWLAGGKETIKPKEEFEIEE